MKGGGGRGSVPLVVCDAPLRRVGVHSRRFCCHAARFRPCTCSSLCIVGYVPVHGCMSAIRQVVPSSVQHALKQFNAHARVELSRGAVAGRVRLAASLLSDTPISNRARISPFLGTATIRQSKECSDTAVDNACAYHCGHPVDVSKPRKSHYESGISRSAARQPEETIRPFSGSLPRSKHRECVNTRSTSACHSLWWLVSVHGSTSSFGQGLDSPFRRGAASTREHRASELP